MTNPRQLPPLWVMLVIGWSPVVLGSVIAALTVIDHPKKMLDHAFFLLVFVPATVPLALVQRSLWRHGSSWRVNALILLPLSFALALASTALGIGLLARFAALPGGFHWRAVFGSMDVVWFVLIAFGAVFMLIGYYVSMQEHRARALAAGALARDAELRALRYQLHPHFLFNTLNAISTLVVEERTAEATRMIARLGDFLRATLEGSGAHEVTLAEELALTEHYLDIEKARLGDRLDVALRVGPEVLQAAVPYLLLQPLVENAIRHGIAPRRHGGRLEIGAARIGRYLKLQLCNDGVTAQDRRSVGDQDESPTIGLRNVRERLARLYDGDHCFTLELGDDGSCTVLIELPFRAAGAPLPVAAGA